MYARVLFTWFLICAGIVHAANLPGLLRPRSTHTVIPRRSFGVKQLQLRTPSSRVVGGLFARQSGCESGYTPCLGDPESCCPPDCLECGDNTATCCVIGWCSRFFLHSASFIISYKGSFCSTDSSGQQACECFGSSCPDGSGDSTFTTSASFAGVTGASANSAFIGAKPHWPLALGVSMIAFMLCGYYSYSPRYKLLT
jgi:hypothetical protein